MGLYGVQPTPTIWRESIWDIMWTDPDIYIRFVFAVGFGAIFYTTTHAALRYGILTRNHVIVVLVDIILFIIGSDYIWIEDA